MNQMELISELKSIDKNELKSFLELRKVKYGRLAQKEELEKRILSVLFNEYELISAASEFISIKDISENHQIVFTKLFDCEPNATSLYLSLRDEIDFLAIKDSYDPMNSVGIKTLSKLVNNHSALNQSILLDNLLDSVKKGNNSSKDVTQLYSELSANIESYFGNKDASEVQSFDEALGDVISEIESEISGKSNTIKSNVFPSFNLLTNGIRTGNLVGFAGSFKSGKSSFVSSMILDFAQQKIPVCLFSLELGKREITSKLASYQKAINYSHLVSSSSLTNSEMAELSRLKHQAKNLPLYISTEMLSLNQIKAKMKILRDKKGVKIFCIDYLGYLKSDNSDFNSREREMTFFSVQLKKFAKELDIAILAIAQLNRAGLNEPSSIHLAESISLARDCDYLFTISTAEALKGNPSFKNILSGNTDGKFIVRLDTSRHTQQGKAFIIGFVGNALKEISLNTLPENAF